jgi:hypothetical protein
MIKWGIITFAIGLGLMAIDWSIASKKKGGVTPTDKLRIGGMFWVTLFATALVVGLIWMA